MPTKLLRSYNVQNKVGKKKPKEDMIKSPKEMVKRNAREQKEKEQQEYFETLVNEIKNRWNRIKSFKFYCDMQKWKNFMTAPINNKELFKAEKKGILKYLNKNFLDGLKKKWKYNENMASRFLKCGYDRSYTIKVIEQLRAHYNIETIYERCYFRD
jgi:hypothetical protein